MVWDPLPHRLINCRLKIVTLWWNFLVRLFRCPFEIHYDYTPLSLSKGSGSKFEVPENIQTPFIMCNLTLYISKREPEGKSEIEVCIEMLRLGPSLRLHLRRWMHASWYKMSLSGKLICGTRRNENSHFRLRAEVKDGKLVPSQY